MWKYIVTWCVVAPGLPEMSINEFGVVESSTYAVNVFKTDCSQQKEFTDKEGAFKFYNRAINYKSDYDFAELKSVKIDSIKVK